MKQHPHLGRTPEQEELDKKRSELSELESRLVDRELFVVGLRSELSAFEQTYLTIVGKRYAELDEIEAKITEYFARTHPGDRRAQSNAQQARSQAEASADVTRDLDQGKGSSPKQSQSIKSLYREVAKRIHPDLAFDGPDRLRREQLMAQANRAYEEDDEARLRAILEEYEFSPESVQGEGPGAELVRAIRKIAQITRRLVEIDKEVVNLEQSDYFKLNVKVEQGKAEGRDVLREMAEDLDLKITASRERLRDSTQKQGRSWSTNTEKTI